jgi:hypothetical protein
MRKPIRYYITKSGDEPTVRAVAVTVPQVAPMQRVEAKISPAREAGARHRGFASRESVRRIVKGAFGKRSGNR